MNKTIGLFEKLGLLQVKDEPKNKKVYHGRALAPTVIVEYRMMPIWTCPNCGKVTTYRYVEGMGRKTCVPCGKSFHVSDPTTDPKSPQESPQD